MHRPESDNSVLLHDASRGRWLLFSRPLAVLAAERPDEVMTLLRTVERRVETEGLFAAGFVAYEAAAAFDTALAVKPVARFPLAWFGLYRTPEILPAIEPPEPASRAIDWTPSIDEAQYRRAIAAVKRYIRDGDSYQVNYSFRLRARLAEHPWSLFQRMIAAQGAGYGAYLQTPDWTLCSASPELFFRLHGRELTSRPMKGTAARGLWSADDRRQADWLYHSDKNRAENLMIVDMVRNDMGRIAEPGSVRVPELFALERYPTLWQMTSTVRCDTGAPFGEIFRALFPAASITGAPKARTMQIIDELEDSPRYIYTGTLGFLAPGREAQFNVAIRTLRVDRHADEAEYGVGGGIVWDSVDAAEFEECRTKARILTRHRPAFELLETLLWTPQGGFFLLERHLARVRDSAEYFGYPVDVEALRRRFDELAGRLPPRVQRVRLLVSQDGSVRLEHADHSPAAATARVCLARRPIDIDDPFLYHKTTRREVYEQAQREQPDCDDVLLWNARGEATESCIANLVVECDGGFYTPPVYCGLLAGTYRDWLLEQGKIRERVIRIDELDRCQGLFLINSVREWRRFKLIPTHRVSR